MNKLPRLFWIIVIVIAAIFLLRAVASAAKPDPAPKVFVCKYVGTPSEDETLQTGKNPISISSNAIKDYAGVGTSFDDEQGRSYVVAVDIGQDAPTCPVSEEVDDVCENIEGNQATVPEGYVEKDGICNEEEEDETKEETDTSTTGTTTAPVVEQEVFQGK